MSAFPTNVGLMLPGMSLDDKPIVERTDMERGVAKVRRVASDTVVTLKCTFLFETAEIRDAFQDWYYSRDGAAAGANWFEFTDPRSDVVRSARIIAGSLGALQPQSGRFGVSKRDAALEFVQRL